MFISQYQDTNETEKFCRMFNRLFNCLNTRNLYEPDQKRNDDLRPDTRLEVIHTCNNVLIIIIVVTLIFVCIIR